VVHFYKKSIAVCFGPQEEFPTNRQRTRGGKQLNLWSLKTYSGLHWVCQI